MSPITGIVIPTLGNRIDFLNETIRSVRNGGYSYITLVKPQRVTIPTEVVSLVDQVVDESEAGLAAAINQGVLALPRGVEFVNWIGDDDLLEPGSLFLTTSVLQSSRSVNLVFGKCRYINSQGVEIGINRSGEFAVRLMKYGPCLVPQPGSLFRRSAFEDVGGLDTALRFAFDLDLFIKLSKSGRFRYLSKCLASFRWHETSLTVSQRSESILESRIVRQRHLEKTARTLSPVWETPGCWASGLAGRMVNERARRMSFPGLGKRNHR